MLRAGRLRSLTLVTALVDRGTDVNEIADPDIRKTALIEACELGDLEMTSLLLSKGARRESMCRKRDNTTDGCVHKWEY